MSLKMYTLLYLTVSSVLSLSLSSKKVAFGNNQDFQFKKKSKLIFIYGGTRLAWFNSFR